MYRVFIVILLILSFPFQVLIALSIVLTSGLPIVFTQKRVGKNGKTFTLLKFRTMRVGSDREQKELKKRNESMGPTFKIRNDPRFTPIGKVLSHTGLDELPQLWNIFKGDMALIGPRPLPVAEAKNLEPWMQKRHGVKPGIISPAILTSNYHKDFTAWMKSDVQYAQTKNTRTDMKLFVETLSFLFHLLSAELFSSLRT